MFKLNICYAKISNSAVFVNNHPMLKSRALKCEDHNNLTADNNSTIPSDYFRFENLRYLNMLCIQISF
jgi:hypothetical protein